MNRRDFLLQSAAAAAFLALTPTLLSGCDAKEPLDTDTDTDDDTDTDTDTDTDVGTDDDTDDASCALCTDAVAEGPSNSHGHTICVTQADIEAAVDVTLVSQDGSHSHRVLVTAEQLADIDAGTVVTVTSTTDHEHTWSVELCA